MNVPLKKRYNYCAINNNENSTGSINFSNGKGAISAAIQFFKSPDNINLDCSDLNGFNGNKQADTFDRCNLTRYSLSTPQFATNRIPQYKSQSVERTKPLEINEESKCIQAEDNNKETFDKAKTSSSSSASVISVTSSSIVITSSATNQSVALSGQKKKRKNKLFVSSSSQKNDKHVLGGRSLNKNLTENSIKLNELQNPPMTTRDRVLNWRLSNDFVDVEDDFDESRYSLPFRSERLQNRHYKTPIKLRDTFHHGPKSSPDTDLPIKKAKEMEFDETSLSASSSETNHNKTPRKRQLLPPDSPARKNCYENVEKSSASAIKLRIDYTKKPQKEEAENQKRNETDHFKVPSIPAERTNDKQGRKCKMINLSKSKSKSKGNDKIINASQPSRGVLNEVNNMVKALVTGSDDTAIVPSKAKSRQEEFYKYLGIDTNPNHEKSPGSSTGEIAHSETQRRSLRVRCQQNAHKFAETTEKERESKKDIHKRRPKSSSSKSVGTKDVTKSKTGIPVKQNQNKKLKLNKTKKAEPEKTTSMSKSDTSPQLVKISYMKPDSLLIKNASSDKKYKAICLLPSSDRPASTTSDCQIISETILSPIERNNYDNGSSSFIIDRRFYEAKAGTQCLTNSRNTVPYTSKVLVESNNPIIRPAIRHPVKTEADIVLVTSEVNNIDDETEDRSSPARENVPEEEIVCEFSVEQLQEEYSENTEDIPTFNTCLDNADSEQNSGEVEIICSTSTALVHDFDTITHILGIPPQDSRPKKVRPKIAEMYRRYKRCLRQSLALKTKLKYQYQQRRRQIVRRRKVTNQNKETDTDDREALDLSMNGTKASTFDAVEKPNGLTQSISTELVSTTAYMPSMAQNTLLLPYEDHAFSPTSISHSNASTDSAIVVSSNNDGTILTTVLSNNHSNCNIASLPSSQVVTPTSALSSVQSYIDRSTDVRYVKNPIDLIANGPIQAAVIMPQTSLDPAKNDVLIAIQKLKISFWQMSPKFLNLLTPVNRSLELIAETKRYSDDIEVEALHQNRIVKDGDSLPVYLEIRARQSEPNEYRQCCLSSVYVNIYQIKQADETDAEKKQKISMHSVQLDTIKGYASTIKYLVIRNSPNIVMCWTEMLVNRTRSGICKYSLFAPDYDEVQNILDFACIQQPIKSLYCLNENHIIGCGDNTVSMWNHQTGGIVINVDLSLTKLGDNLGGFLMDCADTEYLLVIQLMPDETNQQQLVKMITIDLTHSYNWRIVHTHHLPGHYKTILSTVVNNDLLIVTFEGGYAFLLNLFYPQNIYLHDSNIEISSLNELPTNIVNHQQQQQRENSNDTILSRPQVFIQNNGQMLEVSNDYLMTKLAWEFFVKK